MGKLKQVVPNIPLPMKIYNGKWTWEDIKWPVIAMQKYDGIFVWRWGNHILTKDNKPITNAQVVCKALDVLPPGANAEIILDGADFHTIQSYVARIDAVSDMLRFEIFDMAIPHKPFMERYKHYAIHFKTCNEIDDVVDYYEDMMASAVLAKQPFEGLVLKYLHGNYYFNHRTTRKEGLAFKYILEHTDTGVIIGFTPCSNPLRNIIGAYTVETEQWGKLTIGSGFDNTTHTEAKLNIGKPVTFKYKSCGMKSMPRHPIITSL